MAAQNPPIFLQASSHPAEDVRRGYGGLFVTPGVFASGDLLVTQNGGGNMSVNVAVGRVALFGTESTYQGTYTGENRTSVINVVIAASDATNPRIDIIVAKVMDAAYSGASNTFSVVAVTGTPAGSPAAPTTPANAIVLARVAVAALSTTVLTAAITDYRMRTAALGGRLVCTSTTRPTTNLVAGETRIRETNTGNDLVYYGATTGWQRPWGNPWGVQGTPAVPTTVQTGISAITDLTGASVTFTAVANRYYRISGRCRVTKTTAVGAVTLSIRNGATVIQEATAGMDVTNINVGELAVLCIYTVAAGSTTVKLSLASTSAAVSTVTDSTRPTTLVVEDIGPSTSTAPTS